jgi:hypothetical protein
MCRCLPMSEYEELQLLNQLRRVPSMGDVPGAVRRLYRKLCVRRLKRERGMLLFNLDDLQPGRRAREVAQPAHHVTDVRILDRFQVTHVVTDVWILCVYEMGRACSMHGNLVVRSKREKHLKFWHRQEDNIKMDLKEIWCEGSGLDSSSSGSNDQLLRTR